MKSKIVPFKIQFDTTPGNTKLYGMTRASTGLVTDEDEED